MDEDDTSDTEITRLEIKMHKFEAVFNMSSISPFQFPVPWPHGFHRSRLRWLALELKDARLEERIDRGRIGFSRSM